LKCCNFAIISCLLYLLLENGHHAWEILGILLELLTSLFTYHIIEATYFHVF
ncbi:hypothetical protein S245_009052, partial [Arachis hypogaea]